MARSSAGTVIVGDHESCDIAYFDVRTLYPLATYHTHAGFNVDYDSEVPSTLDIESDMASGMDGLSPLQAGGSGISMRRLGRRHRCAERDALPSDPRYRPCNGAAPEESYTLASLRARFGSLLPAC